MMKQLGNAFAVLSFSLLCWTVHPTQARAEPTHQRPFGAGFILGEPTGFSFEFLADRPESVNAGIAWSFDHWTQVWADYVWHFPHFVSGLVREHSPIDAYIGFGGGVVFVDSKYFGDHSLGFLFRIPFGLEYKLNRPPLGFFLELVPGFIFGNQTAGKLQGGIGARFYF